MRKFPAVLSLPLFSSVSKSLDALSINFRDKRTKENFVIIGISIIHSGSILFSQAVKKRDLKTLLQTAPLITDNHPSQFFLSFYGRSPQLLKDF